MKGSKVSVLVGRRYPGLSQILNKLQSRDNKQGTYFARREPMCVALRNNILSWTIHLGDWCRSYRIPYTYILRRIRFWVLLGFSSYIEENSLVHRRARAQPQSPIYIARARDPIRCFPAAPRASEDPSRVATAGKPGSRSPRAARVHRYSTERGEGWPYLPDRGGAPRRRRERIGFGEAADSSEQVGAASGCGVVGRSEVERPSLSSARWRPAWSGRAGARGGWLARWARPVSGSKDWAATLPWFSVTTFICTCFFWTT
jgi:hypothetical protein